MNGRSHSRVQISLMGLTVLVAISLCGAGRVHGADWKKPLDWIPDRFKPAAMGGGPSWEPVVMWDEQLGEKRGLRVALMPVVENEQNLPIDRRMTVDMQTYMRQFCAEVITVLDVQDPELRDRLDSALNRCINQWKQRGRIDPQILAPILPDIALDAVFLFERNVYEQAWRGNRKLFRVGLEGAAFAVDTGDMIFEAEALENSPWSGMQNTIYRVERLAIRSLLDQFHTRLKEIAAIVDQQHQAQIEAAVREEEERKRKLAEAIRQEEAELKELTQKAGAVLMSATQPADRIAEIRDKRQAILSSLEAPGMEQPEEQLEQRRQIAAELETLLAQQRKYQAEQDRLARQPPPDEPVEAPEDLPGSEEPTAGDLLIDFSGILTATPTWTPTPRSYVPPGAFELPGRRRPTPLPPLRRPTPTATPTPDYIPRAKRLMPLDDYVPPEEAGLPETATSGIPLSATAGIPSPATASIPETATAAVPFPATGSLMGATDAVTDATGSLTEPSGAVAPATIPFTSPPSEQLLDEVDRLRRRSQGAGQEPGSSMQLGPSGDLGLPEMQSIQR